MINRSLLDAADSYPRAGGGENRLTEILCTVLQASPHLTCWLLRQAFDEESSSAQSGCRGYEVTTQFILPLSLDRPDLRIARPGQPLLFIENKIDAGFTRAQEDQYGPAISPPHRVMAIVPRERADEARSRFTHTITWGDLYRAIRRCGRTWAQDEWPDRAWTPEAPAEYRMLAELARYLERELRLVEDPITQADLDVLPNAKPILLRWDELFHRVEAALNQDPGLEDSQRPVEEWEDDGRKDKRTLGWGLLVKGDWPALSKHWEAAYEHGQMTEAEWEGLWQLFSLLMAPKITWAGTPSSEPAVGVGLTVPFWLDWPWGLREDDPLRLAAEAAGFKFGTTFRGKIGRVFRTKKLAEIAD